MLNFLASIGRYVEARVYINDLGSALTLMGQGMVGIFVVMAIISLVVFLITKIPSKK